jgi:hypothetical protein
MKVACVCAHLRSGWIELVSIDAEQTQSILFDLCKPGSVFRVSRFWQNLTQLYLPNPFVLSLNTWPITIEPQSFVARLRLFHMLSICNNEHCTALEFSYGGENMWWCARTVKVVPHRNVNTGNFYPSLDLTPFNISVVAYRRTLLRKSASFPKSQVGASLLFDLLRSRTQVSSPSTLIAGLNIWKFLRPHAPSSSLVRLKLWGPRIDYFASTRT